MPDLSVIGKAIAGIGAVLLVVGILLWLGSRFGLGALPGDVRLAGSGWGCFVPIGSMIIVSIVVTILLNIVARLWSR